MDAPVFAWKKSQRIDADVRKEDGVTIYELNGSLFFGAVTSFKEIFNPADDTDQVVFEFKNCQVFDHSALEAINTTCEKYRDLGKTVTLRHLSQDCHKVLNKAEAILEINTDDPLHRFTD